MERNSEKELILLEGKNGSYEQMYGNRSLKNFDILKEGTNVAKMHVTSFNLKKLPDRNIVIELHTVDEIGEKECVCLISDFFKLYS